MDDSPKLSLEDRTIVDARTADHNVDAFWKSGILDDGYNETERYSCRYSNAAILLATQSYMYVVLDVRQPLPVCQSIGRYM